MKGKKMKDLTMKLKSLRIMKENYGCGACLVKVVDFKNHHIECSKIRARESKEKQAKLSLAQEVKNERDAKHGMKEAKANAGTKEAKANSGMKGAKANAGMKDAKAQGNKKHAKARGGKKKH